MPREMGIPCLLRCRMNAWRFLPPFLPRLRSRSLASNHRYSPFNRMLRVIIHCPRLPPVPILSITTCITTPNHCNSSAHLPRLLGRILPPLIHAWQIKPLQGGRVPRQTCSPLVISFTRRLRLRRHCGIRSRPRKRLRSWVLFSHPS